MKLVLFRQLWGVTTPLHEAFASIARRGYAGIEAAPRFDPALLRSLADANGLRITGMVFTEGPGVGEHFDSMRAQIDRWLAHGATQLTIHSARDAWPIARSVEFYGRCVEYERTLPVLVTHETHRGRAFFSPWATRDVLAQVPGVRLCLDLSHWVCVAERLLEDCGEELALAAAHCRHVHARVGYPEGPQVPDPSAPEHAAHLAAHERWWQQIVDAQRAAGTEELAFVPEYGPPTYLHTLPHTNAPVADLDTIVEWASARLRQTLGIAAAGE